MMEAKPTQSLTTGFRNEYFRISIYRMRNRTR